jgi:hypothetical protein
VEIGDDPSLLAIDLALATPGLGDRRTCERGWCRDVDESARLLIPIQNPGTSDLVVTLRARGEGRISLSMDQVSVAADLTPAFSDVVFRVPSRSVASGINVLEVTTEAERRATLDRITLERTLRRD